LKLLLYISSAEYDGLEVIICRSKSRMEFSMDVLENKLLCLSSQIHLCSMCLCSLYLDYCIVTCANSLTTDSKITVCSVLAVHVGHVGHDSDCCLHNVST
jgi:hypothetical protein